MVDQPPAIRVDQVDFSWDLEKGLMYIWGQPVVSIWIETTMAGFMVGLQRMVGTERFNLAMEGAGREHHLRHADRRGRARVHRSVYAHRWPR